MPHHMTIFTHQASTFSSSLHSHMHLSTKDQRIASVSGNTGYTISAHHPGTTTMTVSSGHIPIKKVDVRVLPDIRLVPGGESIGIKMNSVGVLVVGYHLVDTVQGEKSPGKTAGIIVGDSIIKINDKNIEKMADVKNIINDVGNKPLKLVVLRDDNIRKKLTLQPLKDKNDQHYRIGLYIRDSAAGIGTMTFYEPKSRKYGALGHVISDVDTKKPIHVHNGDIVRSTVSAIDKGKDGHPGEKIASFPTDEKPIGNINKNTPFGIFGNINDSLSRGIVKKGLPIALESEIKEGPAKILTVVDGNKVQAFNVTVLNSVKQDIPATKGLVIKVTDPKLLNKTGGIVQGMSGSPIIQNGKIIGAVTHVFVNDPTSGYGCHIEWMLKEAGINVYKHQKKEAS